MCNCHKIPQYFLDPHFLSGGIELFQAYFEIPDTEYFAPELCYTESGHVHLCTYCNQYWYIEVNTEEIPSPVFGLKILNETMPNVHEIKTAKYFLTLLAHNGFDTSKCLQSGCSNYALKRRALCFLHF